ncbi:uncharacterized protein LOC113467646 [Diaphorina citri]|uniref:Uncharacterized protein LOC113467646 n=1 Tax=Diaphorina citri TaxID=121845 RepID=A0A3Q0IYI1_DIACI|nr:uncharacterized protein LOC113467646 [Diaphorina citri]
MSDEEEETVTDDVTAVTVKDGSKMCGYLEKKGKLGVTGRWRSWYCVLDGHLLLQYKSQSEYLSLSPCRGSINLALAKSIEKRPRLEIHIATRSQVILLVPQ